MPGQPEGTDMEHLRSVRHYPYRTARVDKVFLRLPRVSLQDLQLQLANASGRPHLDNHEAYEVIEDDLPPVYIMFSDDMVTFGAAVIEARW